MNDQEMMTDALATQKFVTSNYNSFANECATPNVRNEILSILSEEHKIQSNIFIEMQKRNWYQVAPAEQPKIDTAKQKFVKM